MTKNPYLKRLLGEAGGFDAGGQPPQGTTPPATPDEEPEETAAAEPTAATPAGAEITPTNQELLQMWKSGERIGVAAKLMFSEASYADFVDLLFTLGQQEGRELGTMLDELADTQGIEPPSTPPQYKDLLTRVAGADEEEGVL